jgi:hypothetical protein
MMTTPGISNPIRWTSQLKTDGILSYLKAISAGLVALLASLGIALGDGDISKAEWITAASVALAAAAGAFGPPNKVKDTPPAPVDSPPAA